MMVTAVTVVSVESDGDERKEEEDDGTGRSAEGGIRTWRGSRLAKIISSLGLGSARISGLSSSIPGVFLNEFLHRVSYVRPEIRKVP